VKPISHDTTEEELRRSVLDQGDIGRAGAATAELDRRAREREGALMKRQLEIAESSARAARWSAIAAVVLCVLAAVQLILMVVK
jgi:hypothetical protein